MRQGPRVSVVRVAEQNQSQYAPLWMALLMFGAALLAYAEISAQAAALIPAHAEVSTTQGDAGRLAGLPIFTASR